jgi:hypothetical protein
VCPFVLWHLLSLFSVSESVSPGDQELSGTTNFESACKSCPSVDTRARIRLRMEKEDCRLPENLKNGFLLHCA